MAVEDLKDAAHAAVLGVRVLRERLEEAHQRCDESAGRIGTLTNTLESDRQALQAAVEELDTSLEQAAKLLTEDVTSAESGLTDIATACHEAGIEGLQALDVESLALQEMAHNVRDVDPRVAALAEAAEAASRAALERAAAIADDLAHVVDDAEALLTTDMTAVLAEVMQQVEKAAAEVRDVLDHQCPELLLEKETEFGARMSEAEDLMNRIFPDMETHADEVAEYTVEKLEQIVKEEVDEVEADSRTQEGELENLTSLAAEKKDSVDDAGESLVKAMHENGEGVKTAEQALEEIRARWITFGFAV